jgi:hypothetical protein
MQHASDSYSAKLINKLSSLAERLPRPYDQDRFYSEREQEELNADVATVNEAIEALKSSSGPLNEGPAINAALNAWFATDQGDTCLDGSAAGKYLKNRLEAAFIAGWDARKAASTATPLPSDHGTDPADFSDFGESNGS